MLSKQYQLKNDKDFQAVHNQGKFYGSKFLAIKVAKNDLDVSRFGFIVSLKTSKKAVVRNKVKRRMRAIVREEIKSVKPGFDVVVMVRPQIVERGFDEIKKALVGVMSKAGLLTK